MVGTSTGHASSEPAVSTGRHLPVGGVDEHQLKLMDSLSTDFGFSAVLCAACILSAQAGNVMGQFKDRGLMAECKIELFSWPFHGTSRELPGLISGCNCD